MCNWWNKKTNVEKAYTVSGLGVVSFAVTGEVCVLLTAVGVEDEIVAVILGFGAFFSFLCVYVGITLFEQC